VQKAKVIGQGHHTFHFGGHAWRIGVKCDVWPCLATNISASEMRISGPVAVFDRPLVVLQGWRVSSLQLFAFENYRCVKLAPDAMWPLGVQYAKFATDQPYTQFCVFSTFYGKIKRLNVVCRLEIFCPKMTVGHRENAVSRCLTWRNVKILEYKLRNGWR